MFVRHKYGFELEKIVFVSVLVSGNLHRKECAEQVAPKIAVSIIGSFTAAVVVTRTTTADSTIRSNRGNGNGMAGRVRS